MRWFKFYGQDFLTDPKMMALNPTEKVVWVGLLCVASTTEDGVLNHVTAERIASLVGVAPSDDEWSNAVTCFEKFERLGLIQVRGDDVVVVLNWKKRQETNLTGAERTAKYRRKKEVNNASHLRHKSDSRIEENRIDKNIHTTSDTPTEVAPFALSNEIKKMEDSPRREVNVIALYMEHRKPDIQTKEQFQVAFKRHLRAAKTLSVFTDAQILKAVDVAKKKHSDVEWTIETLVKILTK